MIANRIIAPVGIGLLLIAAAGAQERTQQKNLLADWPEVSQKAAQEMFQKYGQPDGATPNRLIWENKDPWHTIIVYRDPVQHDFPKPHEDVLEQVIYFRVPPEKFDDLAEFDGSVIVERTKGTIAARCDKEPMNFLALNLAHDLINDKLTIEEARKSYAKAAMDFMKGDMHPYTQKLVFKPMSPEEAGVPGESLIDPQQQESAASRPGQPDGSRR